MSPSTNTWSRRTTGPISNRDAVWAEALVTYPSSRNAVSTSGRMVSPALERRRIAPNRLSRRGPASHPRLATKTHCSCGSIGLLDPVPGVDDVSLVADLRFEVAAAAGRRLEREDLLAQVFRLVRLVVDVARLQLPLLRQRRGGRTQA